MNTHQIVTSLVADGEHAKGAEVWAMHLADLCVASPIKPNLDALIRFRLDLALDGPELVMAEVHEQIADAA